MLERLPPTTDPRVLVSNDTVDDAGVYRLDERTAIVVTTDYFPPIVDDPADFGRIAAANAVSDVYAMGAKPLVAVNIACFPDDKLPVSVLVDILLGAREKMDEAGVAIIGGHTVSDDELKYGLAVTGIVDVDRIVTNAAAREGDALVLTKPLGTGVMTTALKNEALDEEALARLTGIMAELNRAASAAMLDAGASAATDVTGFGLVGHAVAMAEASGVTLEIDVDRVPLIDGAEETIRAGFRPDGLLSNQHFYRRFVRLTSRADGHTLDLMHDPQTSGGLLISMPEERLEAFAAALGRERGRGHWVVGRVAPRGERAVVLL